MTIALMVNLSLQMETSLTSVLLEVCKNGCYSQDAGLSLFQPWERLFAFFVTGVRIVIKSLKFESHVVICCALVRSRFCILTTLLSQGESRALLVERP